MPSLQARFVRILKVPPDSRKSSALGMPCESVRLYRRPDPHHDVQMADTEAPELIVWIADELRAMANHGLQVYSIASATRTAKGTRKYWSIARH